MLSGVANSISSWLGATKPDDSPSQETPEELDKEQQECDEPKEESSVKNETGETDDIQHQLDEMGTKAVKTAKDWGNWLYGIGKTATSEVVKTAQTVKKNVEEKTILGDFNKEQDKFVTEKKEKQNKSEAAVPPWVGYNEEESMKQQIMALSTDQRNFLRNPPAGVQFHFDFEASFPVAMATLQEDPNLKKMRFDLVPKQVKEEVFWRNYFYRVSLIKQSAQLTSLTQQTDSSATSGASSGGSRVPSEGEPEGEELVSTSPPDQDDEFISDAFQSDQINEEDLKKEMQQLGMAGQEGQVNGKGKKDMTEWERELQAELNEYEVVDDSGAAEDELNDAELENELLQQLEAESTAQKAE